MKKTFMLILVVIALQGLNAATVSADGTPINSAAVSSGVFVPLSHGVDH